MSGALPSLMRSMVAEICLCHTCSCREVEDGNSSCLDRWEHPHTRALWVGRALPRVWLEEDEQLTVREASSAYGRLSFTLRSKVRSSHSVLVNVTVPPTWRSKDGAPPGGLALRLRVPKAAGSIAKVTVDGAAWADFNATTESIHIRSTDFAKSGLVEQLQHIMVHYVGR